MGFKQQSDLAALSSAGFWFCSFPIFHYSNIPIFRFVRAINFALQGCTKAGPFGVGYLQKQARNLTFEPQEGIL